MVKINKSAIREKDSNFCIYVHDLNGHGLLSKEEEIKYTIEAQKGDKHARDKLITSNLRLVISIAKNHIGKGLELTDLIGEGNIGLMKAVDRFDLKYNCRFSTYASWWIHQTILRALQETSRSIRLPVYVIEIINKIKKARYRIINEFKETPTKERISDILGIPIAKIEEALRSDRVSKPISLSTLVKNTENEDSRRNICFDQLICDNDNSAEKIDIDFILKEVSESLENFTKSKNKLISARNIKIFKERMGINENKEKRTLQKVADDNELTKESVRQIVDAFLIRIKRNRRLRNMYKTIMEK